MNSLISEKKKQCLLVWISILLLIHKLNNSAAVCLAIAIELETYADAKIQRMKLFRRFRRSV